MSRYERAFNVQSSLKDSFQVCKRYFTNTGYSIINASFPSTLVLKKSGSMWTATELNEYTHDLTLFFNEVGLNQITLRCIFNWPDLVGNVKEKHFKVFEPMLESLQNEIKYYSANEQQKQNAEKNHVDRERIIERQIVKVRCRYCGALNNDGHLRCESCGALL